MLSAKTVKEILIVNDLASAHSRKRRPKFYQSLCQKIPNYELDEEPAALKRAEYTIKAYELKAIAETEKAFLKATNRKSDRRSLAYFFGILKNIQQKREEDAKKQYCQKRYNYQVMLKIQRQQNAQQDPISIDDIVSMLEKAVTQKPQFVKELALRRAREWTQKLMESYTYIGSLKKKLYEALGKLNHQSLEQKQKAWELLDQFLNPKSAEKCVTLSM